MERSGSSLFSDIRTAACILAILSLVAAGCSGPAAAEPAPDNLRHYSIVELAQLLEHEGYGPVKRKDGHVSFTVGERKFTLFLYPDGDLQIYFGIAGPRVPLAEMNRWNRDYRLSRAYVDDVDDPVLEADLLANAGLNPQIISEFVLVFISSSDEFRRFVAEHDRGTTAQPASDDQAKSA